jgi:hypothetical protein
MCDAGLPTAAKIILKTDKAKLPHAGGFRVVPFACAVIWLSAVAMSLGNAVSPIVGTRLESGDGIFEALQAPNPAPGGIGFPACFFEYEPGGSKWVEGVDESKVFHAAIVDGDLRLGIGKGGQIYSIRGPFGEAVPPQRPQAPWIDEVWHLVVTNEDLIAPIHHHQNENPQAHWVPAMPLQYFIHQAGIYLDGLTGPAELSPAKEPFYSPLLESRWDPDSSTLFLANWAQQARAPNVWKSGALVLTAYRAIGGGAVEVTQSLTNFGTEDFTYLNAPWGGVRHSSLPQTVLSGADGDWSKVAGRWGWSGIPSEKFTDTGGWIAWTSPQCRDADPALALVFGREAEGAQPWKRAPFRIVHGTAGDGAERDYNVVEASCSVLVRPGGTIVARWYLVSGPYGEVRKRAAELSPYAGMWMPEFDGASRVPVWMADGKPSKSGEGTPAFHLHAVPAAGTVPVFLIEDLRSGKVLMSADPYLLARSAPLENPLPVGHPEHARYQGREVFYPYEGPGRVAGLLGFAGKRTAADGSTEYLSAEGTPIPSVASPAPQPATN